MHLKVKGEIYKPSNNTVPNNFNYKKYLYYKRIYYLCDVKSIKAIKKENTFYKIKNLIIKRINSIKNSNSYILTFIIGDKSLLDEEDIDNFRKNGITHLFAISGMHIGFFSMAILTILKRFKIKETKRYITTILFILFYMFLTSFSESVLRSGLFFILLSLNKIFYTEIKTINILLLTLIILLLINPYILMSTSFQYSFMTTLGLVLNEGFINKHKVLGTSLFASLFALPINIYNFYEFNPFSILLNIIFVPFVSMIIYPFSLLTFIFRFLNPILILLIKVLEWLNNICSYLYTYKLIMPKMPLLLIFLYYVLLISRFKYKYYFIILILIVNLIIPRIDNQNCITFLDVKQGDSSFLRINKKNILIDTGGNPFSEYHISDQTINYLKSMGISKLHFLIITHGDADHCLETINIVNNMKVEKVVFNCGEFNDLEKELIRVLDKKNIKYYSCIKELNIDNNKLYFLQTKEYDNENDNSNVIYTELNGYKFIFMGDASITTEKELLNNYNLSNIDVLKVGHHGSRTSSSKEFVDEINPKYSIISVGKKNHYGHPNKEVLNNLYNSKIYRTDEDGSIIFKIKKNNLKIETCAP